MSSMPELRDVTHTLIPLQGKYFELGIQLKLDHEKLKAIENEHKGNQSRCFTDTIILWQQNTTSGKCSWSTLAEAVNRVGGYENLVSELKERDNSKLMAKDLMEIDSKPHMPHLSPAANVGCLLVNDSDSTQFRPQRHALDSRECKNESGYSSKTDSGNSSGPEAECFELAPSCGCTQSGKKPCSIYTLCAGECPNPTRMKMTSVVRKKSTAAAISSQNEIPFGEEHDIEDYEESTKEIHRSFGTFVCSTSHQFKASNVEFRELTLYLRSAYPVMKPRMEELSKVSHFEDFFAIVIDQACSWFGYEIIKDLILRYCPSAKSCLDQYEAYLKKYAEQRLPKGKKHIEIGGGARRGGKQLVIKIDKEWEEVTISDLDKLRGTFASILGVRRSDLYLADIREGCIMMTFMITEELAERLFPSRTCLTSFQIKSLKDEEVLSVKCGSLSWRAVASNNKSDHSGASPETGEKKVLRQKSLGQRSILYVSITEPRIMVEQIVYKDKRKQRGGGGGGVKTAAAAATNDRVHPPDKKKFKKETAEITHQIKDLEAKLKATQTGNTAQRILAELSKLQTELGETERMRGTNNQDRSEEDQGEIEKSRGRGH